MSEHPVTPPAPAGDPRLSYAYYPGCSLHSTAEEFDRSTRFCADRLGMTLAEVPDWICCGSTPAHMTNHVLSLALPAETLLQARKMEPKPKAVIAPCSACYSRLRIANYEIKEKGMRDKVAEALGEDYAGDMEVRHLLDVVVNDVGLDAIAEKISRHLHGLKIASYYGCLLTRPHYATHFDDTEHPTSMDRLVEKLGGTPVDYPFKTDCCGASFAFSHPDVVWKLTGNILKSIKNAGAQAIMVACPLCQSNLDLRQSKVAKELGIQIDLPVFYFTQLLGFCLGGTEKDLEIKKMMISAEDVMEELELKSAGEVS